jgi:hypothetical protein
MIFGCISAIQTSLIALNLHENSMQKCTCLSLIFNIISQN